MRARARLILLLLAVTVAAPAMAVEPHEILNDPALEARARDISKILRCLVCQNQSIDDSDAPLARDLRILVRERLVAGDSDTRVINYLVDRYGEFVLLKPKFESHTLILWLAPTFFLFLGAVGLVLVFRRRKKSALERPLSSDEKKAVAQLLDKEG